MAFLGTGKITIQVCGDLPNGNVEFGKQFVRLLSSPPAGKLAMSCHGPLDSSTAE